ncbi:MAG: lactonase family protein [Thalassotalea sp.]
MLTAQAATIDLIIGTYSKEKSEGVYTSSLDLATGQLSPAKLAFKSKDPTYLAVSNKNIIYGAMRESTGLVTALTADSNKQFNVLNQQAIHGKDPCYISLSFDEKYLATANYNGANVSIFTLSPSGEIQNNPKILAHTGSSINPKRQASPHPHWVKWSPHNEQFIYVIDLGLDQVIKYTFDANKGQVTDTSIAYNSQAGSGPRHLVFHPSKKLAYILNEITNSVDLVNIEDNGSFTLLKQKSTLPDGYSRPNQAAHIAINKAGTKLYTSNRGLNSIAVFNLDNEGDMSLAENVSTGGDWPRFFTLLEQEGYLLVANKKSNNIAVFKLTADGSLLTMPYKLSVAQPTFIAKYPVKDNKKYSLKE